MTPLDWLIANVETWLPLALSVAALWISIVAIRQRAHHYAKPTLIDDSSHLPESSQPYNIVVRNVGNATATDVKVTYRSYVRGKSVPWSTQDAIDVADALVMRFSLNPADTPHRNWALFLSWRQGPNFRRMRRMRLRIPPVTWRDRIWQRVVRPTPYVGPSEPAEVKPVRDIGIY